MKFDIFDRQMRSFEQSLDRIMPNDIYMVARLDGHGFTRLTKIDWDLKRPFDERFHDVMLHSLNHLVEDCNFNIVYGYTQSDEISILFSPSDKTFNRKDRKLLSITAAEASVAFSMKAGRPGVFDCRIIPLPDADTVIDYFRWRQEDALRNALGSYCYWMLRDEGCEAAEAAARIKGVSTKVKKEILLARGINFDGLPTWQRYGSAIYFKESTFTGSDRSTNTPIEYTRRRAYVDDNLMYGRDYGHFLHHLLFENGANTLSDADSK